MPPCCKRVSRQQRNLLTNHHSTLLGKLEKNFSREIIIRIQEYVHKFILPFCINVDIFIDSSVFLNSDSEKFKGVDSWLNHGPPPSPVMSLLNPRTLLEV
jgi:hypothetical protein